MTLYKEELKYLAELLTKQTPWWVRDNLIKKIEAEISNRQRAYDCDHSYKTYTGETIKCNSCGQIMKFFEELSGDPTS